MVRTFRFPDPDAAARFVAHLAEAAVAMNRHPHVTWSGVEVRVLSVTHDAGDRVTELDHALMARLETLAALEAPEGA